MPAHAVKSRISKARQAAAAEVAEARENVHYWKRQSVLRTHPDAIAQAQGLLAAWTTTLAAREAALDALAVREAVA